MKGWERCVNTDSKIRDGGVLCEEIEGVYSILHTIERLGPNKMKYVLLEVKIGAMTFTVLR